MERKTLENKNVCLKFSLNSLPKLANINKTPIVVGGTGLYFKSLTDGLVKIPEIPNTLRNEIREMHEKIGQKTFFEKLIKLDPFAKNFVSETDSQRSMRAYEVKKFTNKSISEWIKRTNKIFDDSIFRKLFINVPKTQLHNKINNRVARQIFTKIGPLAFLPISDNETSFVYSINHSNTLKKETLTNLVNNHNSIYKINELLGDSKKIPQKSEMKNIKLVRRSYAAARKIIKGEKITKTKLILLRPGNGYQIDQEKKILGKKTKKEIESGKIIFPKDLI